MENPEVENAPKARPSILTSKLSNGSTNTTGEGLDRRLEKKMWTKQRIVMGVALLADSWLALYEGCLTPPPKHRT